MIGNVHLFVFALNNLIINYCGYNICNSQIIIIRRLTYFIRILKERFGILSFINIKIYIKKKKRKNGKRSWDGKVS